MAAAARNSKSLEELLKDLDCPVCLESHELLLLLPCQHRFCKHCIGKFSFVVCLQILNSRLNISSYITLIFIGVTITNVLSVVQCEEKNIFYLMLGLSKGRFPYMC